jgi:hypothetical protein
MEPKIDLGYLIIITYLISKKAKNVLGLTQALS